MKKEKLPQSDDIAYRDYLLGFVDEFTLSAFGNQETFNNQPYQNIRNLVLQNLKKRFKQDFGSKDNTLTGANRIAIEVLKAIIIEDIKANPKNIPVQGNLSDRQYLDDLIAFAHMKPESISKTYHIQLTRLDYEQTTRVHENILTLQGYFRDDKFNTEVNPFFLYKEEWRQRFQTPFFPENHYTFKTGIFATPEDRTRTSSLINDTKNHRDHNQFNRSNLFISRLNILLNIDINLTEAHRQFMVEEYGLARSLYAKVESDVSELVNCLEMTVKAKNGAEMYIRPFLSDALTFRASIDPNSKEHETHTFGAALMPVTSSGGDPFDVVHGQIPGNFPYTAKLINGLAERYDNRGILKVDSPESLNMFQGKNVVEVPVIINNSNKYDVLQKAVFDLHDDLVSLVPHIMFLMLPVCKGDIAVAIGDFPSAGHYYSMVAREQLLRGPLMEVSTPIPGTLPSYDLPWDSVSMDFSSSILRKDYPYLNRDCELPFIRLRLGKLYLAWADQLYRSDQEAEIYRARELYKAVLRLYGIEPDTITGMVPLPYETMAATPGVVNQDSLGTKTGSQKLLAKASVSSKTTSLASALKDSRFAAYKDKIRAVSARLDEEVSKMSPVSKPFWIPIINAGLSPMEIAQPLVALTAQSLTDSFSFFISNLFLLINPAILSQQTRANIGICQIDNGLNYYGYTDNLVPLLRYRPLAATAQHFATLAQQAQADFLSYKEHAENAEIGLVQLRNQVAAAGIRVQIESQRIIQARDYMEQARIQLEQVNDVIAAKKQEIADHNSVCGQVSDFFGSIKDFFTGVPDAKGIALFGVGAGLTMSGMANSANQRVAELQKLTSQQLPMAFAALDARTREVTIAEWNKAVATLDALTAQELLSHAMLRTLNVDIWTYLSGISKTILHRYLDLGAMTGWLAERALTYDQDRDIRLIRFDYFKLQVQGLMGADILQSDLALLDKEYITGIQQTIPIKWTVSLARDFPLQFGQLKAKGKCSFITNSSLLEIAHPGSFNHRIRAIEISAIMPDGEPLPRGMLINPGISFVSGANSGDEHVLVRPPDAFPLSEFKFKDDRVIYEFPGETLMPFEGSGVNTSWQLEFPPAANPDGLSFLADLCITLYLQSRFSQGRKSDLSKAAVPILVRSILFSAKQSFPELFQKFLINGNLESLKFPIIPALLPGNEKERQIYNLAVYFLGKDLPEINCKLSSDSYQAGVKFTTNGKLAHSTRVMPPSINPLTANPLDVLAAGQPEQNFILTVSSASNPNLNRKEIIDIMLGIEYTTKPAYNKS